LGYTALNSVSDQIKDII